MLCMLTVHGDSAFASVAICTALLEHSTYFSGILKTAHKEFPKMESETITCTVPRRQVIKSYFEAACSIDVHIHL